jgi:prophage antirepressor-like protein
MIMNYSLSTTEKKVVGTAILSLRGAKPSITVGFFFAQHGSSMEGRAGEPNGSLVTLSQNCRPVRSSTLTAIGAVDSQSTKRGFTVVTQSIGASVPAVFNFNSNQVRTVIRNGDVWFVAVDICNALGYANSRDAVANHLDDDERSTVANSDGRNGGGLLTIINESGLYALVLRSRKPEARKFAKWVTSEVLPSIRKTGSYQSNPSQIEAAYKLASHVAAVAAQTVFQAILSGDDASKYDRWMFRMDWHKETPTAWAAPIESDAMVVSIAELPQRLLESGATYATNHELLDIASACHQRLSQRLGKGH